MLIKIKKKKIITTELFALAKLVSAYISSSKQHKVSLNLTYNIERLVDTVHALFIEEKTHAIGYQFKNELSQ